MHDFDQAGDVTTLGVSDEDDLRLFGSLGPRVVETILLLKRDDPKVTRFAFVDAGLNEVASQRLGYILGQNTHLKNLSVRFSNLNVIGLCAGLQSNRSIQELRFSGSSISDADRMSSLAPILTNNPSLRSIGLVGCNIDRLVSTSYQMPYPVVQKILWRCLV